ncbi:MAG: hypothetical protein OM95_06345 [Bdellovibrio sp. ArHS]|uniref:alpha/beta hydrolase n=1 Tax=Bdellovibrio sp. ArHS TaxID=1569284 RepID=UPI000583730D|nr:alpha/beta hydrolase [Bdellovibrio sp. ArHS]KHD88753.1 MAG: hypothetical protein OM95_06345 [Bdellovibrio sp. ArHS]
MEVSLAKKLKIAWLRFVSRVFPKLAAQTALDLFLTPQRVPRPSSEMEWFASAKKYILGGGIAAYEWGAEKAPLVLLIHGWSGRGTQMAAFAEPLVAAGYRVVALDGPAHGASLGVQTNVGDYSQFLLDAQKELGSFAAVIAHSFGAGCSVLAAAKGLRVEKLILVAGPSHYQKVINHYFKFIQMHTKAEKYFIEMLAEKAGISPYDMDVGAIGSQLHVKSLIVHDRDDREVRFTAAEEIQKLWPQVGILETQGLGHRRVLKDAQVIEKVVRFIQSGKI